MTTLPLPSAPDEFDPDDNFGQAFGDEAGSDEDAALEAVAWQWLLLVNPGDEEAALEQFATFRDALAEAGDDAEPTALLRDAIDWKAGFHIAGDDPAALVDALDELAARVGLRIDWDLDDEEADAADAAALVDTAFDQLREHHYTLWTWETGSDHHAGWITRQRDDEALRVLSNALGFHVRTGSG